MTLRRDGKAASGSERRKAGKDRFSSWIHYLVILQTVLLLLIFLKVFDLFPEFNFQAPLNDAYFQEEKVEAKPSAAKIPVQEKEEEALSPATPHPVRIEVLNGCGLGGIAKRTADFLQLKGYDIRDYKNADRSNYEKTSIIVRSGNKSHGEALASTISFPVELIVMDPDPNLIDVDVTLILGKDRSGYILPP